jgi:asparagine synthase (glutamine-hydrolysing)
MGGLDGRRELVEGSRGFELAPEVVKAQGRPLLGFDVIGHYRMFQFAREHGTTVVLEGQGADEIFGGYPFYEGVAFRDRLRRLQLGDALSDLRALSPKYGRSMPRLLASYLLDPLRQAVQRHSKKPLPWLDLSSVPVPPPGAVADERAPFASALNRLLYEQTVHTNLPAVLLHQDHNSMAHSVESRVPYLDHRIVELAFALPPSRKVIHGDRKKILRDVARPMLPALITDRKDKRAIVSTNRWIDLRARANVVREIVRGPALAGCPLINHVRAVEFVDAYMAGRHSDDLGVWRLVTAAWWLDSFRAAPPD